MISSLNVIHVPPAKKIASLKKKGF